jgi:hypothetical protein
VAFSPDAQRIASGRADGTLHLRDTASGQTLKVMKGHVGVICSLTFSPDGRHIASGVDDGTLRLWDAASGQTLKVMEGHQGCVHSVAFSADGNLIASGSDDGTLRLWDAATGQTVKVLHGHQAGVQSVAFSPDGRLLACGGEDSTVRLWTSEGQEVLRMRARSSAKWETAVSIPDAAPNWVTLDFRQDPRGRWSGQGEVVDTVRYVDATQAPQPWPWVPRYWRASDLPELHVDAPTDEAGSSARKTTAKRKLAARPPIEDKGPA